MKREQAVRNRLCAGALAVLMGGCSSTAASPAAISSSVYQAEIAEYRLDSLQRSHRADGYTVESGALLDTQGAGAIVGSLVAVRSPLNAVTAIIDRPGKRGLLLVDEQGRSRFIEEPAYDYLRADAVPGDDQTQPQASVDPQAEYDIDALVAFSTQALNVLQGDPVAFALAQLETVNLGLHNSGVANVRLNLAGVVVTPTDHGADSPGLAATQAFMDPLRPAYLHDLNVGYYDNSPYAGIAYVGGRSNVNGIHYPMAFRHEVGHNVGGRHCHPDHGDHYKYGHQTPGGAHTHLCGNNVPYYSTPHVGLNGHPLGNASTADMARLWREQAARLSGHSPAFAGQRMTYVSTQPESRLEISTSPFSTSGGIVALTPEVGPTRLSGSAGTHTQLQVPLKDNNGKTWTVNLRAQSQIGDCARRIMNSSIGCHPDNWRGSVALILSYDVEQNRHLPAGWYNGSLELKALDPSVPGWSRPILVSVSVQR